MNCTSAISSNLLEKYNLDFRDIHISSFDAGDLDLIVVLFRQHVRDIVPRMPVQSLFEPFLVHEVADESYGTTKDEQRIYGTYVDVLLGFLAEKSSIKSKLANFTLSTHLVKLPQFLSMSTNEQAMTPSTFKMRFGFLLVVSFSTSNAYCKRGVAGKLAITNSLTIFTLWSGLFIDFTLWPMPMISWPLLRIELTNSAGCRPADRKKDINRRFVEFLGWFEMSFYLSESKNIKYV